MLCIRDDWQVDNCPASDVTRRNGISMTSEITRYAKESRLIRTVSFIHTTTYRTGARGITGINFKDRNPGLLSLVSYKAFELIKRPAMQTVSLSAPNRHPLADPGQIFQGYRSIRVLRFFNNLLADTVVYVFTKPAFFTRKFFELAPRRFGSHFLKLFSKTSISTPKIINFRTAEGLTIGIGRKINNSQVNPQGPFNILGSGIINITRRQHIEVIFEQDKVRFAPLGFEVFPLSSPTNKGDFQPAVHRPNRNGSGWQIPGQDPVIVGNCAGWPKFSFGSAVQLIGIGDFSDTPNHNLSRQTKPALEVIVESLVQIKLAKHLVSPGIVTNIVTSLVSQFKGLTERMILFFGWDELDWGCKFHNVSRLEIVVHLFYVVNMLIRDNRACSKSVKRIKYNQLKGLQRQSGKAAAGFR